ncbi:unnamed protein product [Umbelopsis ramanniana]
MVFKVFLREGIVGGFAGPTVKQVIEISGDHNGAVIAHSTLKAAKNPIGNDDIYGRDISLGFFTDEFQWQNGDPEGCNRSPSSTQATEQQMAVFNEPVERVLNVSQKFAIKKQD